MSKTYVGDIGTELVLDVEEDITDAVEVQIEMLLPDKSIVTLSSTRQNETDVVHVSDLDTFPVPGIYRFQAIVQTPQGKWRGETVKLKVYDRFR